MCTIRPPGVSSTTATLSGIECAIRMKSSVNGPTSIGGSVGSISCSSVEFARPCSSSFDLIKPEREPRREHAPDTDLPQHVRQRADVVLVPVREDDRLDADGLEVAEVREHEVDAEVLVPREREAGVDDDRPPVVLVHGHVLADLAEPAERDDPD